MDLNNNDASVLAYIGLDYHLLFYAMIITHESFNRINEIAKIAWFEF